MPPKRKAIKALLEARADPSLCLSKETYDLCERQAEEALRDHSKVEGVKEDQGICEEILELIVSSMVEKSLYKIGSNAIGR